MYTARAIKPSTMVVVNLSMVDGDWVNVVMINTKRGSPRMNAITFEKRPRFIKIGTNSAIAKANDDHLSQVKINRLDMTESYPSVADDLYSLVRSSSCKFSNKSLNKEQAARAIPRFRNLDPSIFLVMKKNPASKDE